MYQTRQSPSHQLANGIHQANLAIGTAVLSSCFRAPTAGLDPRFKSHSSSLQFAGIIIIAGRMEPADLADLVAIITDAGNLIRRWSLNYCPLIVKRIRSNQGARVILTTLGDITVIIIRVIIIVGVHRFRGRTKNGSKMTMVFVDFSVITCDSTNIWLLYY